MRIDSDMITDTFTDFKYQSILNTKDQFKVVIYGNYGHLSLTPNYF